MPRTNLQKKSLTIAGHQTSVLLEPEFWSVLEGMAVARKTSLPKLIADIDEQRDVEVQSLASALRVTALQFVQLTN